MKKGNDNKALIKKMLGDTLDETFVLSAIEMYCNEILSDSTDWGDKSLINQTLWQPIASQNLAIMEDHYK